jgi:hypothetical protein
MHCRRFLLLVAMLAFPAAHTSAVAAQSSSAVSPPTKWLGTWEFGECWPTLNKGASDCIQYELLISQEGNQPTADLDMDGFQTLSRFRCVVKPTLNGISIVFAGVREPGLWGDSAYKPGDELFELTRKEGKILTTWIKLTPTVDKYKKTGVRFVKVDQ